MKSMFKTALALLLVVAPLANGMNATSPVVKQTAAVVVPVAQKAAVSSIGFFGKMFSLVKNHPIVCCAVTATIAAAVVGYKWLTRRWERAQWNQFPESSFFAGMNEEMVDGENIGRSSKSAMVSYPEFKQPTIVSSNTRTEVNGD